MAMREGRFARQSHGTLAEGTVRGTISFVSSSFRDNGRANPTKDEDGDLGRVLSRLFRAFRNKDPNPKQQKALHAQLLVMMYTNNQTESQEAIGQLGISAFFWAMRSCEYLKVPQAHAMAMSLDQIPVYVIMMIGRWSSDAFLKYIRKQVEQFSHNMAKRMIKM